MLVMPSQPHLHRLVDQPAGRRGGDQQEDEARICDAGLGVEVEDQGRDTVVHSEEYYEKDYRRESDHTCFATK